MWRYVTERQWHRHNAGGNRVAPVPTHHHRQQQQQQHLLLFVLVFVALLNYHDCEAFIVNHHHRPANRRCSKISSSQDLARHSVFRTTMPAPTHLLATEPMQVEEEDREEPVPVAVNHKPVVEPNTHDELMYALGVNLARQLGDVRPLVESSEELTHVAKGLLDTVIGRVSEDFQRDLLVRRGKELNALITDRACVTNVSNNACEDELSLDDSFVSLFFHTAIPSVIAWNEQVVKC
jgi:hypothetical protein